MTTGLIGFGIVMPGKGTTELDYVVVLGAQVRGTVPSRAVQLAKHQQYENVCGIAASAELQYLPHYMVREFLALVKEKLTGNI